MSQYLQVKDYRSDLLRLGRPRFQQVNLVPVLLTANPESAIGAGYFTRPNTAIQSASVKSSYARKLGMVADNSYLVIPIVKGEGRPFPERIGVGRTRATDIILSVNNVSKYHCYFSTEAEQWCLTDANSSNGTFLNGVRLEPMKSIPLADHSVIALGGHLFLFLSAAGFCEFLSTP